MLRIDVVQKALVLNKNDEILILRRSGTDTRRPLEWDLPGGALDEGEDLTQGVEREITEETGLKTVGTHVIYAKTELRKWETGEASVNFIFYASRTDRSEVKLSYEHDQYEWLPIEEAIKKFTYSLHRELMQYVIDNQLEL